MKPPVGQSTTRQAIIRALQHKPQDVIGLSRALGLREKEIVDHLPHIAKSVAGRGGRLVMEPARCLNCGFVFKERRRLAPPSRCPRCKQSRIEGPAYQVKGLSGVESG